MAFVDIQRDIEKRLGKIAVDITLDGLTDDEMKTVIALGYISVVRKLQQVGDIRSLRHFMKTDESAHANNTLTKVKVTAVDPSVFTNHNAASGATEAHGFLNGDIVTITNMQECTELNGMSGLVVENKTSTTFELKGISADPAETTGGIVVRTSGGTSYIANDLTISGASSMHGDLFIVKRYDNVTRKYYTCTEISSGQDGQAQDPYSPIYATAQHPVYSMVDKDKIRVRPAPTGSDYLSFSYLPILDVNFDEDTKIFDHGDMDHLPSQWYLPIMYYSVSEIAGMAAIKEVWDLKSTVWNFTVFSASLPTVPVGLTINPVIYTEYDLPTAPTYTSPVAPPEPSNESFSDIIAPIFSLEDATLDAFIADDDYEMSSVSVQKLNAKVQSYGTDVSKYGQEVAKYSQDITEFSARVTKYGQSINKYSQEIQETVQRFSADVTEYNAIIAKRVAAAEGHMAAEINSVQNEIADYRERVTSYGQQVARYQQEVNKYTQDVNENIQSETAKITKVNTTIQMLVQIRADYSAKFENFMAVRPAPQNKQQKEEA